MASQRMRCAVFNLSRALFIVVIASAGETHAESMSSSMDDLTRQAEQVSELIGNLAGVKTAKLRQEKQQADADHASATAAVLRSREKMELAAVALAQFNPPSNPPTPEYQAAINSHKQAVDELSTVKDRRGQAETRALSAGLELSIHESRLLQLGQGCDLLRVKLDDVKVGLLKFIKNNPAPSGDVVAERIKPFLLMCERLHGEEAPRLASTGVGPCNGLPTFAENAQTAVIKQTEPLARARGQQAALNAVNAALNSIKSTLRLSSYVESVITENAKSAKSLSMAGAVPFKFTIDLGEKMQLFPEPEHNLERRLSNGLTMLSTLTAVVAPLAMTSPDQKTTRNITVGAAGTLALGSHIFSNEFASKALDQTASNRMLGLSIQATQQDARFAQIEFENAATQLETESTSAKQVAKDSEENLKKEFEDLGLLQKEVTELSKKIGGDKDAKPLDAAEFNGMQQKFKDWAGRRDAREAGMKATHMAVMNYVVSSEILVNRFTAILTSTRRVGKGLRDLLGERGDTSCRDAALKDYAFCQLTRESGRAHFASTLISDPKLKELVDLGEKAVQSAKEVEGKGAEAMRSMHRAREVAERSWVERGAELRRQGVLVNRNLTLLSDFSPDVPTVNEPKEAKPVPLQELGRGGTP